MSARRRPSSIRVDSRAIARAAVALRAESPEASWDRGDLLRVVSFIDLAALSDNETPATMRAVCERALSPLHGKASGVHTAAVCVFPDHVAFAEKILRGSAVKLASVAGGFPGGRLPLAEKVAEIRRAREAGARELDVVIRTAAVGRGDWRQLYDEVAAFRAACGRKTLKVILKTGTMRSLRTVAVASRVAMEAGADFIKTSTGKERLNATLSAGIVMARSIREYHQDTGRRVGLKPAGGIRTPEQARQWLTLVRQELGERGLDPRLFRIGASGLVDAIEQELAGAPPAVATAY